MVDTHRLMERVDALQQRHNWSAFAVGVVKKYGDDGAGNLAALLAYYGFLSLFPLLLVAVTVLGYVLHGHPGLQHDVLRSALADFPVIGSQIARNVTSLRGNVFGLVIGLVGTFYGGLGVANAAQLAMNRVWDVPKVEQPGFVPRLVRSLALVATIGVGVLVTTALAATGAQLGVLGPFGRAAVELAVTVLQIALFVVAFDMLTAGDIGWRSHVPGAIPAGILWQILSTFGSVYVDHGLRGMSQTYGMFAIVIGLLTWIYLLSQVVLFAAEINVVRARRLWPRQLAAATATVGA
jgi:YihY family inner membrane protein